MVVLALRKTFGAFTGLCSCSLRCFGAGECPICASTANELRLMGRDLGANMARSHFRDLQGTPIAFAAAMLTSCNLNACVSLPLSLHIAHTQALN